MIVPVTPDTVSGFVRVAEQIYSESALHHIAFSTDRIEQFARMAMVNPFWFIRVVVVDDQVRGAMCGYLTRLFYSDRMIGVEEGIYVDPDLPFKTKYAGDLVKQFVEWCEDNGAVDVRTGVVSGINDYAADVFYRRNGFKRIGSIYALKNKGDN